eukprot:2561280-Pyramimonas_sp.AAC.1
MAPIFMGTRTSMDNRFSTATTEIISPANALISLLSPSRVLVEKKVFDSGVNDLGIFTAWANLSRCSKLMGVERTRSLMYWFVWN